MTEPPVLLVRRSRLRVGIGAAVVLTLVGLAIAILVSALGPRGATTSIPTPTPISTASTAASERTEIYVHLLGAVGRPGLLVLRDGDRAVDAVAAAGGFAPTADHSQLNLARLLVDGEQIYVPAIGEVPVIAPGPGGSTPTAGGTVNLNTADETALETLPRVGPALAKRILDWRRTNGRFTAIEDLMSVTGVGQKTFDGLKDLVTV